jgi:outer membrane protein assembly factor BamA
LYEKYQQWGLIEGEEADGGIVPVIKVGLVVDTRDNRPNPMKGIATEVVIESSPEIMGAESSFNRLGIIHRQYFTLIPRDLSFAYRLGYQTTLSGKGPFYYRSQMISSVLTQSAAGGLGGAKTLRGVRRNRVVGDGVVYGNAELRWKFVRFDLINNHFYLGLNAFTDFGKVTKKVELENQIAPVSSIPQPDYFNWGAEKMHYSYGAGLRAAMNENFIIAVDYGLAADKQDGTSGFYMGLNYLF